MGTDNNFKILSERLQGCLKTEKIKQEYSYGSA